MRWFLDVFVMSEETNHFHGLPAQLPGIHDSTPDRALRRPLPSSRERGESVPQRVARWSASLRHLGTELATGA